MKIKMHVNNLASSKKLAWLKINLFKRKKLSTLARFMVKNRHQTWIT
jgi:hypothetical protein